MERTAGPPAGPQAERLPVLILTGPTGSGKSEWAISLAENAPVEIVSVDSAQVYRGLDIGSAKPDRQARERVPHHLIDVCDPTETYSAGRFVLDALRAIEAIHSRRRVPLLTGGTMLYFRALLHGLAPLPQASPEVRRQIDERATREGWSTLHAELQQLDPVAASRIHTSDAQRIQRALEVCYCTGRPLSELQRATTSPLEGLSVRAWALAPANRAVLHEHLSARFHAMMTAGFLDEVKSLHRRGDLQSRHSSMRSVGYRQLWAYLDGEYELDEAVNRGIAATRQLAKRQLTWLRSLQGPNHARTALQWLNPQMPHLLASWISDVEHTLRELGI